ncbi:MAG TPA: hypothetical protein DCW31_03355 [Lactobacillus sp.]|nr:hypothetical protein [Lactobacillus sp.]
MLVLAVTTSIIGLGVQMFHVTRQKQAEDQFIQSFVSLFERAKAHTMLTGRLTTIDINENRINYTEKNHPIKVIKMPTTLSAKGIPDIFFIENEMLAPRSILFTSSLGGEYRIKTQLGWGVLHVEKPKR